MTNKKNWAEDSKRGAVIKALTSVTELQVIARVLLDPSHSFGAGDMLPPERREDLRKEYEALNGETQSEFGLFGAIAGSRPDMVGASEIGWLQRASRFAGHLKNAIARHEPDDDSELLETLNALFTRGGAEEKIDKLMQLQLIQNAIDTAFPPKRGRSAAG